MLCLRPKTCDTWITRQEGKLSEWHQVLLPKDAFEQPSSEIWFGYVCMILYARSHKVLDLLVQVNVAVEFQPLDAIRSYLFFAYPRYYHQTRPEIYAFACENTTVLNYLLYDGVVGDFSLAIGSSSWPLSKRDADAWGQCLTALMGADKFDQAWLHSTNASGRTWPSGNNDDETTPLSSLLQGYCYRHSKEQGKKRHSRLISVLQFWLHLLRRNQVDLIAYGLHERQLIQARHPEIGMLRQPTVDEYDNLRVLYVSGVPERLLDIKYGPDPRDWDLIWDLDIEQMVGDFWTSLNEPEFPMPGQWVEE